MILLTQRSSREETKNIQKDTGNFVFRTEMKWLPFFGSEIENVLRKLKKIISKLTVLEKMGIFLALPCVSDVCLFQMLLRTVPTKYFCAVMTMWEKQILARSIGIQKENWG